MFSSKKLWPHLHMKKCKTRRLLIVPISDLYIKLIIVISLFTQPAVYFGLQKKKKKKSCDAAQKTRQIYGTYYWWYNKFVQFFIELSGGAIKMCDWSINYGLNAQTHCRPSIDDCLPSALSSQLATPNSQPFCNSRPIAYAYTFGGFFFFFLLFAFTSAFFLPSSI